MEIGVLVCFCALQNHGFDILCSFSAILQHTPRPPLGFSILKAGLKKSVLLSVYNSPSSRDTQCFSSSHGILLHLSYVQRFSMDPPPLLCYLLFLCFCYLSLQETFACASMHVDKSPTVTTVSLSFQSVYFGYRKLTKEKCFPMSTSYTVKHP